VAPAVSAPAAPLSVNDLKNRIRALTSASH